MTNPNDVVHPICQWQGDVHSGHTLGLSKREYFAAMALQGILANDGIHPPQNGINGIKWLCATSVRLADVLIEELNK